MKPALTRLDLSNGILSVFYWQIHGPMAREPYGVDLLAATLAFTPEYTSFS